MIIQNIRESEHQNKMVRGSDYQRRKSDIPISEISIWYSDLLIF